MRTFIKGACIKRLLPEILYHLARAAVPFNPAVRARARGSRRGGAYDWSMLQATGVVRVPPYFSAFGSCGQREDRSIERVGRRLSCCGGAGLLGPDLEKTNLPHLFCHADFCTSVNTFTCLRVYEHVTHRRRLARRGSAPTSESCTRWAGASCSRGGARPSCATSPPSRGHSCAASPGSGGCAPSAPRASPRWRPR
eukprot:2966365-Pyramimonas_sp.AAC.1